MHVALVCDDLIQFGGAERVVMAFHDIWPDAPLYTTAVSQKWVDICREKNISLRTSFMQKLPFIEKLNRYYSAFLFHVLALESFDFSQFDLVVSSSSRFAHGIITKPQTVHVCYMHSPGRMFWESTGYFENENYGFLKWVKVLAKPFLAFPLSLFRVWDISATSRVDAFMANSQNTASKIKSRYGKNAQVIYPFTDVKRAYGVLKKSDQYYVLISRLLPWKHIDVAVKACTELGVSLKIIGVGPDEERLRKMSGSCVEFMGYLSEQEKINIIDGSRGLIQTQKEDFGIVPLEALSRGKPVIVFGEGGVLEYVTPQKNGEFYKEQTPAALKKVILNFDPSRYETKECVDSTVRFSKEYFMKSVKEYVDNVYLQLHG